MNGQQLIIAPTVTHLELSLKNVFATHFDIIAPGVTTLQIEYALSNGHLKFIESAPNLHTLVLLDISCTPDMELNLWRAIAKNKNIIHVEIETIAHHVLPALRVFQFRPFKMLCIQNIAFSTDSELQEFVYTLCSGTVEGFELVSSTHVRFAVLLTVLETCSTTSC